MPIADRLRWAVTGATGRRMLICVFTGFSSGLPLYFLIQLVPAWLRAEEVSLREIGFFALVQLPYAWKFIWAPLLDRYRLSALGRRRSWMLATQLALLAALAVVGWHPPADGLRTIMALAFIVAVFSATQDIALDAFRRELLPELELGLGNSIHVQAYRISGLIPGALALVLADHLPWAWVFVLVALWMVPGILMTLVVSEPNADASSPQTLISALVEPFREFLGRAGWRHALAVLAFIFFYKLGDSMATALSTPFYLDLGFSLTEIGVVAKNAALWPSIIGGLLGGALMLRIGINRALWLFGAVQLVTIGGFAVLAAVGDDLWVLALVITLEYLGVGLGTAAFVAFMARESAPALAATQIALFTALAAVPRIFANALTGFLVEGRGDAELEGASAFVMSALGALGLPEQGLGWVGFYLLCMALAVPGMLLLLEVAPWSARGEPTGSRSSDTQSSP